MGKRCSAWGSSVTIRIDQPRAACEQSPRNHRNEIRLHLRSAEYRDSARLIPASRTIAIDLQTIAAASNRWRPDGDFGARQRSAA
jgi:hypothetical protein